MSRFFVGLALWALLLALAACGGDSNGTDPARDTELAEMVDTVVSTYDDLTVCTDKREGTTAYVEDEKKAYVCESKRWTANDSLTESIQNKDSDSAKDAEPDENVDTVVPTFDDLPSCTKNREGATAYVEDEDTAYVCKKGLWVVDDSLTKAVRPDSEKKSSSSAKAKSSSNETSDSSSRAKSNSSKDGKSSSSDEKNSSSSSVVPTVSVASPCKTEAGDNCEYGTLTDDRDGQTYKTVKIGDQVWMAENLNYRYIQQTYNGGEKDSSSYCYNDDPANCEKYGRLYLWSAALVVCPEGWHLPDTTEWNALFNAVGGGETAGIMLKSTEGWYGTSGNGSDAYSFSALPAGNRFSNGNYSYEGNDARFWSSTEVNSNDACSMYLYYILDNALLNYYDKGYGFSVRCLKDYGPGSEKMSSNGKSSSSEKNSSSSSGASTVSVASPCKTEAGDNCEYGTLTDERDGQTYKTVKIGEQWWMAENLNYAYIGVPYKYVLDSNFVYNSDSTSWCFNDSAEYCSKYGRLYSWSAAMDSSGIVPGNAANGCGYKNYCNLGNVKVRGVCPKGWHLPDSTEWFTLFTAVGGKATAGMVLKSTEGWNDIIDNDGNKYDSNGSDNFGFSALPAGRVRVSRFYDNEGIHANFWSSTEYNEYKSNSANIVCLNRGIDYAHWFTELKDDGYSVRCVKD